jgi:hypothetical protein
VADHASPELEAIEKLAVMLRARGYETRLLAPAGRLPSLAVTNPWATALSETIMVEGQWFWWSWAERIAEVGDLPAAAASIHRVLSTGSSST